MVIEVQTKSSSSSREKATSHTPSPVTCFTGGTTGEAFGRGLGVGVEAGFLSCKNKITAVTTKIPVNPSKPHNNHFLSLPAFLAFSGFFTSGVLAFFLNIIN